MTYEEDYAYHLLMYGKCFNDILNSFIEKHPNVIGVSALVRMSRSSGEVGMKAESFYLRWNHDERCMSEKTKMFVRLFEENPLFDRKQEDDRRVFALYENATYKLLSYQHHARRVLGHDI